MEKKQSGNTILFLFLLLLSAVFLAPILMVLMNSFKGKLYISDAPFQLPSAASFAGLSNYFQGVEKSGFFSAFGYSLFITVFSVAAIVLLTSMTGWWLTRVKGRFTGGLYYLFVFSMVVPFQMVMFTMSKLANMLYLDNPVGMIVLYVGFGAGLSVFMFCGFVKSIPIDIEEAAMIDGCNPIQTFFRVVLPIMKPTAITVAILNTMWIWNDYLLPSLIINKPGWQTLPLKTYLFFGQFAKRWDLASAGLIMCIIPIIIFYLCCQKYIVKGITDGAIK